MVLAMTATAIVVFGVFVTERENNSQFESAITAPGRLIVILMQSITSHFITTVFAGIVTNLLSPTRAPRLVSSYLAPKESQARSRNSAAARIVAAFDERRCNCKRRHELGETVCDVWPTNHCPRDCGLQESDHRGHYVEQATKADLAASNGQ